LLNHYSWFPVPISTIQKYGPVLERGSRWTKPGRYVGNGPFTIQEWRLNDRVRVKRSATYWDAQNVRLNEIVFHTIDSNDIEERAFRSGQLHVTDSMPINRIDRYRREHPEFLRIDPYLGTYFYRVNVTRPVLNNRLVRRALAMAIDRHSIDDWSQRGGQFHYQVIRSTWIGDYVDPNSFLDLWVTNGANNQTGWSNTDYDRLIGEASQTGDQAARYAAFQKAEAILLEDAPILPVYFYTHAFLIRPSVKGWYPTILDHHPYKYVWLEQGAAVSK